MQIEDNYRDLRCCACPLDLFVEPLRDGFAVYIDRMAPVEVAAGYTPAEEYFVEVHFG